MSELLDQWRHTLPHAPATIAERFGNDLVARWSEPHRHYHTRAHLADVLAVIDEAGDGARDLTAVRLAAWFHDAVYDPRRVDNEEASALLAEACLPQLLLEPRLVTEVARLVRLTASHDPDPADRDGGLLTDADLSILASAPEAYERYRDAIRLEYAHLADSVFRAGRAAVLANLLSLAYLFHTPRLRERWEEPARANLTRELGWLRRDPLTTSPS